MKTLLRLTVALAVMSYSLALPQIRQARDVGSDQGEDPISPRAWITE